MEPLPLEQGLRVIQHEGPLPGPSQQFERQKRYYKAHKQRLLQRFADKWICIDDEEVVESAATQDQLLARLHDSGPCPHSLVVCVEPGDGAAFIGGLH
ncbi:hypothetical protein pneo_cds_802 [Pandoravirus neocaledonia]|uniref:DUF5678 domain-containing protein n=1 Tax=Pandoravirus neocaledonia TaxID=2107708 RepID=A0A2U7UD66_9VIRU|nr:hypothetical protein pneo_cds_802 [Pandoravirus neocaledonia]AVK76409.1 hypothetical protein pneo_cds_802 [Pandoravirus neocaledonia]